MAAFAAAVKIDSFAYMPVQDFGNAFSTFIAQNFGAGQMKRIRAGIRVAVISAIVFCVFISILVFGFARPLMLVFVPAHEAEIISIGVQYLRIEGAFYCGIGCLFLLYGFYRGIRKPGNVCDINYNIFGDTGGVGLRFGCNSGYRSPGNLVVDPYRLVLGGCCRNMVLP